MVKLFIQPFEISTFSAPRSFSAIVLPLSDAAKATFSGSVISATVFVSTSNISKLTMICPLSAGCSAASTVMTQTGAVSGQSIVTVSMVFQSVTSAVTVPDAETT